MFVKLYKFLSNICDIRFYVRFSKKPLNIKKSAYWKTYKIKWNISLRTMIVMFQA